MRTAWTVQEVERLREVYPRSTIEDIRLACPGRSDISIFHKAARLKLLREERPLSEPRLKKLMANLAPSRGWKKGKVIYPVIVRDGIECKCCRQCHEWKPIEKFAKHKTASGGRANVCVLCHCRIAYTRNPEAEIRKSRKWQTNHRDHYRLIKQASEGRRRSRMKGAGVTPKQLRELRDLFGGMCAYCHTSEARTFDHVVPLAQGGPHQIDNLLPACMPCNMHKNNKTPEQWLASQVRKTK